MAESAPVQDEPWSTEMSPRLRAFCRDRVYQTWVDTIRSRNGELQTNFVGPFLGFGPKIPVALLPILMQRLPLQAVLGRDLNMITVVLTPAHNRIVFLAAERFDGSTYAEMIRLDDHLSAEFCTAFCRMLQVGEDHAAFDAITDELRSQGLERFAPGMIKVADLGFFESFLELWELRGNVPMPVYIRAAIGVAREVIESRSLYFYPSVPLDRLLRLLRAAI
jgi:hypothetical protein